MIQEVARRGLCTQCCFCAALCPAGAIAMRPAGHGNLSPRVDPSLCTSCGVCLEICSGRAFPFDGTFRGEGTEQSREIGAWRTIAVAHAGSREHRRHAASGGVVTALLAGALEAGLAGRALVVPPPERGLEAEARLAATPEEVLASAGSWYLPVDFTRAVREAAAGPHRVAAVGLPCHIQAWRKASQAVPRLREKLALTVGLFCDHLVDERFWALLLRRSGIDPGGVEGIRFRGEGWPGSIRVRLGGGREDIIPYDTPLRKVFWKSYLFTQRRCLFCHDALAEFADVSVGDPWLPEYAGDALGRNIAVLRTRRGEELFGRLLGTGALTAEPLAAERLAASQRTQLFMKKREIGARAALARAWGRAVPDWEVPLPRPTWRGRALGAGALALSALSRSRASFLARVLPWRAAAAICARGRKRADR